MSTQTTGGGSGIDIAQTVAAAVELAKLKALKAQGLLTDEAFAAAKASIESTKTKKLTCEVRPDIFINWKDERELFITRKAADINNTDSYEMICDAPRVKVMYDKKKECTSILSATKQKKERDRVRAGSLSHAYFISNTDMYTRILPPSHQIAPSTKSLGTWKSRQVLRS